MYQKDAAGSLTLRHGRGTHDDPPIGELGLTSCNPAETAAARRGLARTVASGSDVNPLRNRRRSDMASPPENRRNYREKSRYDPYSILPAEFPETQRSVQQNTQVDGPTNERNRKFPWKFSSARYCHVVSIGAKFTQNTKVTST